MVADMLFLAKTERGVDLPHKERFMAADEAQALLDFYEAVADDKGSSSSNSSLGMVTMPSVTVGAFICVLQKCETRPMREHQGGSQG